MIQLFLRPAAKRDIADIWLYTADNWGVQQADKYVHDINTVILGALEQPDVGSPVERLGEEYRKLKSGSHRIIYRLAGAELIVVRVLHERMDVEGQLG